MRKIFIAALAMICSAAFAQKVEVFNKAAINTSGKIADNIADGAGVIRVAGGRVIFKTVNFDKRDKTTTAVLNMTLASAGDRWDKSGSCFIIPRNSSTTNLVEILRGNAPFPSATAATRGLQGIIGSGNYEPAVELMRFMTPFGVGYYSDDKLDRRPVYIPFWEKQVQWSQDISQLISSLQGEAIVGVWIDTWTPEGYEVSLDIDFKESALKCDKIAQTKVIPLLNTVAYGGGQQLPDLWAYQDVEVDLTMPSRVQSATLYYIVTGHGGHSGGDEFVKKQNIVYADGAPIVDFIPWRDDCAAFRRFNPGSGVWLRERNAPYISDTGYAVKRIEESLASSDLSRSNWCPGSSIVPERAVLPFVSGSHKIRFSIPDATPAEGEKLNHWLVSAYVVVTYIPQSDEQAEHKMLKPRNKH